MAERKAVNKYYPPEWTPSKGSINKFRGSHPLRERARKLHEGILIIRFEMPYNIWCNGCNNHIGMSVRFNAQKSKTGMYYSTPIYKFRMKCHLCDNHFEMQTDPKNLDYVILSGARRQELRWDPKDNEQIVPEEREVSKKLMTDSMFKLEHEVNDKEKASSVAPAIQQLEEFQERWKDDYSHNRNIRQIFRTKKKEIKAVADTDRSILKKLSLPKSLKLLPETPQDSKLAQLMKLESTQSLESRQQSERNRISSHSVFDNSLNIKSKKCVETYGSKLFNINLEFEKNDKNFNKSTDNSILGVKSIDKKTDKKVVNSLVAYNSSDSE